ncbi:TPM domain-containing protein [Ornithinimicrobium sp. Y1694]|uniref:TPM domain-containing protein n=1 Tax=Ornithinimicrobium sp. Y1694 TaxID=3418590 RepID=UPI003CEAAA57
MTYLPTSVRFLLMLLAVMLVTPGLGSPAQGVGSAAQGIASDAVTGGFAAEPPRYVLDAVTDDSGVLTAQERESLEDAIRDLREARGIDLYVVYTRTFDSWDGQAWAEETFSRAGLGEGDVLLAVAVESRRYGYMEQTELSAEDVTSVMTRDVQPHLRDGEWAQAGVAAAEGLDVRFPWLLFGGIWAGVLGVVGGGWGWVWRWDRRSRRKRESTLLAERQTLAGRVVRLDEQLDALRQEQAFAETDLSRGDVERLRNQTQEAARHADDLHRHLAEVPSEPGRRPPVTAQFRTAERALRSAEESADYAQFIIDAELERLRDARQLRGEPTLLDDQAQALADAQVRATDLRSLTDASSAQRPLWLQQRLLALAGSAGTRLESSQEALERARPLATSQPGNAGAFWRRSRENLAEALADLDRLADPDGVERAALVPVDEGRERLRGVIEEAERLLAKRPRLIRSSRAVRERDRWRSLDIAPWEQALARATQGITHEPDRDISPEDRLESLGQLAATLHQLNLPWTNLERRIAAARRSRSSSSGSSSGGGGGGSSSSSGGGRF